MVNVVEINEITALPSYRLAWSALHAQTPRASFPQTPDGLESWWRCSDRVIPLRVLIVRAGERPIGIVPLVEQLESGPLGTARVLTYPPGVSSPIGPFPTATLTAALRHLTTGPPAWEVLAVRGLRHDAIDRGRTALAMRLAGLRPRVEADGVASVVDFAKAGGWPAYLAARPAGIQQGLKSGHEGALRLIRHRPEPTRCGGGETRWDLYDACRAIDDSHSGPSAFAQITEEYHGAACRLGMIDVSLLMAGDRPVAYRYGHQTSGEVTTLCTGFDPAWPHADLGLLGRVLEEGFARGDERLDLGPSDEETLRGLRTGTEALSSVSHIALRAWRPRVQRVVRRVRALCENFA